MSKNIKVGLEIKAGTDGVEQIIDLSKAIKQTGIEADHLTKEGMELAETFNKIEREKGLVDNFKRLKKESVDVANQLEQQQQKVADLAKAMQAVDKPTKAMVSEFEKAKREAKILSDRKKQLNETLHKSRSVMQEAGISTKNLTETEKRLATEAKTAQKALDELTEEAKELKDITDAKITLGIDTDDKARKEIEAANKAYKTLEKSGKLSSYELASANELHTKKVQDLETQLSKAKPAIDDVAMGIGKIVSAAGGLALISRQAMSFESAMVGVKKVVDATPAQMKELSGTIKELAVELGMIPEEVAEITAMGGQLGVAFEDLPEFTRLAGQMAVAFNMTAEEAGNVAAKLANVFQIPMEEVRELGDAINTLGNNTAAKEREISEAMLRIGGNSKQFGLAAEQAAALTATMIALGKPPEIAATSIKALLNRLQTAPAQTAAFKDALGELGMSAEDLAADIQANPQQALTGFLKQLEALDQQSRSIVITKMFGAEYSGDIALIVGALSEYERTLGLVADKSQTAGAMQEEFDAAMDNTTAQINQAKTAINNIAITLGTELLPIIGTVAETVGGVAKAIGYVAEEFPSITRFAVLLGSAKVAIYAVSKGLKLMGIESSLSFAKIVKGARIATGGLKGLAAQTTATAASMTSISGKTRTLKGDIKGLGKHVASLTSLLHAIVSFDIGWSVGTWARESFGPVRTLGDEMARSFAMIESLLTTGSLEKYNENFRTQAELSHENYLLAIKREGAAKAAAITEENAAKAANQRAKAQKQYLDDVLTTYQQLQDSRDELEQAGETETLYYRYVVQEMAKLAPIIEENNKKIAESGKVLDDTATKTREFEASLKEVGLSAGELFTGITDNEQKAIDSLQSGIEHINNMGLSAKQSEDAVKRFIAASYKSMKTPEGKEAFHAEMDKIAQSAKKAKKEIAGIGGAMNDVGKSSTVMTVQAKTMLAELGVDTEQVMTGISSGAKTAMSNFSDAMKAAQKSGTDSMEITQAAIQAVLDTLSSDAEFKSFGNQLKELNLMAKATSDQQKTITEGSKKATQSTKEASTATKEATQSTKEATTATKEATTATQADSKAKDDNAKSSQTAGSAAAALANQLAGVRNSFKESEAAVKQFDAVMMAHGGRMGSWLEYDAQLERAGAAAKQKFKEYTEALKEAEAYTQRLTRKAQDGTISQQDFAGAALYSADAVSVLNKADLAQLSTTIESARQKMLSLEQDAKRTAQAIADRLTNAVGSEEEKINLRYQREAEAIKAKAKGGAGQAAYNQALADLEKLRQIELDKARQQAHQQAQEQARQQRQEQQRQEQQRQRQEREREQQQRQRQQQRQQQRQPAIDVERVVQQIETSQPHTRINAQEAADKIAATFNKKLAQTQQAAVEGAVNHIVDELDKYRKGQGG